MKKIGCGGSMGDAYLITCYLKSWGDLPLEVYHSTRSENDYLRPLIREIYSLLPNVKLKLVTHGTGGQPSRHTSSWASPGDPQLDRETTNKSNFTPFPEWDLPVYPGLPKGYSVLAPRSGKPREKKKVMSLAERERAIGELGTPVVMLGTNTPEMNGVTNLSGKTTILEALSIISGASSFSGFQGMLAYMALSQKVPSYVYVKGGGEYNAFNGRIMPQWVQYCLDIRIR